MSDDGRQEDPGRQVPGPRAPQELRGPQTAASPPAPTLQLCQICGLTYAADSRCPRGH
ncbi:MAG TPA: hypothetical protein VF310_08190 [Vicinamibacteria bacterium]